MFLQSTPESHSLNQYWYSERTIAALVSEIESGALGHRIAFLSTPSVYFSLPANSVARQSSIVFDIDEQWSGPNFRRFDFRQGVDPDSTFTAAIVDPPFVTRDVWLEYARAVRRLLAPGGRLVLTTIPENKPMLVNQLGPLHHATFLPAMHTTALPYQYALFLNYDPAPDSPLASRNPEVPDDLLHFQTTTNDDPGRPLTGTHLSFDQLLARELQRTHYQGVPRA